MDLPVAPTSMIDLLRGWFFASDRSVILPSDTFIQSPEITTPGNASTNTRRIYPKTDGWYSLEDDGTEVKFDTSIIGGSGWTDDGTVVRLTTSTDNVTIGSTSDIGKLGIVGDANEVQLVIRNFSSQAVNSFEMQVSGGTAQNSIDFEGASLIDFETTALTKDFLRVTAIANPSSAPSGNYNALSFALESKNNNSESFSNDQLNAIRGNVTHRGTNTLGDLTGLRLTLRNRNTGAVTRAKGVEVIPQNTGAGITADFSALYINTPSISGGSITVFNALLVEDITGAGTNNSIVTGAGNVSLGDITSVIGRQDAVQLTVKNHSTQTTNSSIWTDSSDNVQISFSGDGGAVFNSAGNTTGDFVAQGTGSIPNLFADASVNRVGIGTSTPRASLDIDSGVAGTIIVDSGAGDLDTTIQMYQEGSLAWLIGVDDNEGDFFRISTTLTLLNAEFTIDNLGKVGIGVTTPLSQLHVVGSTNVVQGIFKGFSTQTTDIFQIQDDSAVVIHASGDGVAGSEWVMNESGIDIDFRVETADYNGVFVDASNN